jgi:Transposase IS116/IS110/IS902 family
VVGFAAAIGTTERSPDPQHLVVYLTLSPSVCQSGEGLAYHGLITKQGCVHAPGMLVDATWAAARLSRGGWGPTRPARRGCSDGAQAYGDCRAHAALERGLCLGSVGPRARRLRDLELRGERCPATAQGSGRGPGPKHVVFRGVLNRLKPPLSGSCEAST